MQTKATAALQAAKPRLSCKAVPPVPTATPSFWHMHAHGRLALHPHTTV